jgi:urocanate hydratase
MGAWEIGNFGNDDAMDFVSDVNDNGKAEILNAIQKISNATQSEYLEAPDCSIALAAIEYIAAAKNNIAEDFPEEATEWLEENQLFPFKLKGVFGIGVKEINIVALSHQAIDKIKTKSELQELWEESEDYNKWLTIVEDLKKRIS